VQKPPGFSFIFDTGEPGTLGSVETAPLLRIMRPATFALWFIVFCVQAVSLVSTGEGANGILLALTTFLFVAVHVQFWYEESEQGAKVHNALERMRGKMYEDEITGLPNSRHFVFELRRQMMRSVRNGRGFSLVLTDFGEFDRVKPNEERFLPSISRAMRHAVGEGDFVAHLQGPIFAAIISDDADQTAAEKADNMLPALGSAIPQEYAHQLFPVVSLSGYEGELEVRDFLRRAQRDLAGARANGPVVTPAMVRGMRPQRGEPAVA